jgi:hypothetical protein
MKSRKLIIALVSVFFLASTMVSCHRSTCPTFGKVDKAAIRLEVRS